MRTPLALCLAASVCFLWSADDKKPTSPPQQRPARPVRPGVKAPGVQIPMSELKPDAVFEVPGTPDWLAIGDGVVYVSNKPKDSVSKLDARTDKVLAVIPVGSKPCSGLTIGFGSLWVPNCGDNTVSRIDLKTDKVTATFPIAIGDTEGGIATGAGSVWMMVDKKGTLARIDPADDKIVAEIPVAPGSYCVAFGEGAVWITSTERSLLTRVDPN